MVDLSKKLSSSVEEYFKGKDNEGNELPDTEQQGKELKKEIDKFIHAFYNNDKESKFDIIGGSLRNILEKLELSIKDEINPGLGTLNRLFIASELLHLQKRNWDGIRLGLIEEIEAHLHPQAQIQVIEALQKEENIQLILTTHSPNLGSKINLKSLIICNDNYAFSMGPDYTALNPENYTFLERFLDVTKANLFFAKGVILVEGWAEEILLPAFARKLKSQNIVTKDLTEAGVSVVNISNTAFLHYSRIFLRKEGPALSTPVAILTDVDVPDYKKFPKKDEEGHVIKTEADKIVYDYLKQETEIVIANSEEKKGKIIEKWKAQNVDVFVAPSWTLEYSLYKSTSLGENFCASFKSVHPQINEAECEAELAKKLINKGLGKTEIAYRLAQTIERDENIIIDENDEAIKYIIDALKYVCNA